MLICIHTHTKKKAYSCHHFIRVPFYAPSLLFLKLEAVLNIIKYALAYSIMYSALYLARHSGAIFSFCNDTDDVKVKIREAAVQKKHEYEAEMIKK